MKKLTADRLSISRIDGHVHICDLIRMELPLLSLFSDSKRNWLYLWCDTDGQGTHRWWLFTASRENLAKYLRKETTLRDLLHASSKQYILDQKIVFSFDERHAATVESRRRHLCEVVADELTEYLPSEESYFDDELGEDIEAAQELLARRYDVPIDGEWYGRDFQYLFKTYENLYAFYYGTRPRFVRTTRQKLGESLRAPWRGGHSRVNFFGAMTSCIPAQHVLKVQQINYQSPGEVEFEALLSVGQSIRAGVLAFEANERNVRAAIDAVRTIISAAKLNKTDLSTVDDQALPLESEFLVAIQKHCDEIARLLGVVEEFLELRQASPNIVVFGKAVGSFVRQLERLVNLQSEGMLNFHRSGRIAKGSSSS